MKQFGLKTLFASTALIACGTAIVVAMLRLNMDLPLLPGLLASGMMGE